MRKTSKDFKELESMTNLELKYAIKTTKEVYDNYMDYLNEYEAMLEEEAKLNGTPKFAIAYPKLTDVTNKLSNLESYIRKAENILNEYEPSRQLQKIKKHRLLLSLGAVECYAESVESEDTTELPTNSGLTLRKPRKIKSLLK